MEIVLLPLRQHCSQDQAIHSPRPIRPQWCIKIMCFVQFYRVTGFSLVKMICWKWFLGKFLVCRSCLQRSNIRTNSGVKNGDAEVVQPVHWFFFFCPRAVSGSRNAVKSSARQWQSIYTQNQTIFQLGRDQQGSPSVIPAPCRISEH